EDAVIDESRNVLPANEPDYKEFIPPAAGRRMAKGVKNGIAASTRALQEAGVQMPEAIITGTGMGCINDSEKFLKAIIDNKEEFLTPTSFIQSTHNTVGAQIALGLQCKAYNFTYVNGAVSFESSLIDAKLQIDEEEASTILVGGIEEWAAQTNKFLEVAGMIKSADNAPFKVLASKTTGSVLSEGAVFFVLDNKKQDTTYAQLKDIAIYNVLDRSEVAETMKTFLESNKLSVADIDAIVLGYNGDVQYDDYYTNLAEGVFAATPQIYYKHLSGEFNTVSAFGLWAAANIMKTQQIPEILKVNFIEGKSFNHLVLYNQYRGQDHSFTLISKA
ncbi:MAG: 3-oxoacyl-ACP synthase, partial [Flavobacterium sp.]